MGLLAAKSPPAVKTRLVLSPSAAFGRSPPTDPLTGIEAFSVLAAASCSSSTGGMSPRLSCSRSWLNQATHWTVATSTWAWERQTRSAISSVGWLCLTRPLLGGVAVVAEGHPKGEPKRR